ncbi:MAG TPA: MFS transporter [Nitrosomonas sp.]|nr:MFS transporter [Nitrosomonas sp.]
MDKQPSSINQDRVHRIKLPQAVIVLGLVSFFNDVASDMVIPLIPILLASVLASGPIALGLIEGIADALASFLKLWSGRHTDAMGGRRKALAVVGYSLSNFTRPLLGIATSWLSVLILRSIDRVGKGLRSAPRDALIADATPVDIRGYAFGFHRALDNSGAVAGSLIAAAILAWSGLNLAEVILWSALPGAIAVVLFIVGVKETQQNTQRGDTNLVQIPTTNLPPLRWSSLSSSTQRYLIVLVLFTFARASETFIILLGYQLGIEVVELLIIWAAINLSKALTSTLGGQWADRYGRGNVMLISWVAFAIAFLLLSFATNNIELWAISVFYELFAGLGEGAERALIVDYAHPKERGTAFGWYHLMTGLAAIPAGLLFGSLWQGYSAALAFVVASGLAVIASILLRLWAWPNYGRIIR